jgi:anthranilate/para-aminobenzoate synthase component I
VLGRRQIEMYSKLIHTVDHVEGYLRPGFDALDAFLCHTWAVTVTGAPKTWAIQVLLYSSSSVYVSMCYACSKPMQALVLQHGSQCQY